MRLSVERGYPPSIREIGSAMGMRSTSTVASHLYHLEGKGAIERSPGRVRAMRVRWTSPEVAPPIDRCPLCGQVRP